MSTLFTDKLLMNLPLIYNAKTAFSGALANVQVLDGVTDGTKAFKVKRSATPVVVNDYDEDLEINATNGSRFGKVNEVTYGDVDVDYSYLKSLNEALDQFTVNQDLNQAVADRHELQSIALTRLSNSRIGKYLSQVAHKALTLTDYTAENVSALFNQASADFTENEIDGNLYAYVTPTLFNAMIDLIQFKSLTGASVDVNNNKLINYKGFAVESTPSKYFATDDAAYFTAEKIVIPFIGIQYSRTIEDSRFGGQLLQSAIKGGQYIQEENKIGVVKATLDTTVHVSDVSTSQATATLKVGDTKQVTATVTPENAADKSVSWKSDNESVATVASDGTITAVAVGSANVTVTTTDGAKTATVKVTVNAAS